MPGFDGTGPMGAGPMTGGARGRCRPANLGYDPRYTAGGSYYSGMGLRRGFRGGFGRGPGRGFGRGYRWDMPYASSGYTPDADNEVAILKADAQALTRSLEAINNRIAELEKQSETP